MRYYDTIFIILFVLYIHDLPETVKHRSYACLQMTRRYTDMVLLLAIKIPSGDMQDDECLKIEGHDTESIQYGEHRWDPVQLGDDIRRKGPGDYNRSQPGPAGS